MASSYSFGGGGDDDENEIEEEEEADDTEETRWMNKDSLLFLVESTRQTFLNLWRAGLWWQPRTWWQAGRFLFGFKGLWAACFVPLLQYLRPGFHPDHLADADEMAAWLQTQREAYAIVSG